MGADIYLKHDSMIEATRLHGAALKQAWADRDAIPLDDYRKNIVHKLDWCAYADLAPCDRRMLRHPYVKEYRRAQANVWRVSNAQPGYFRDSYNDSSVLWRMGLSWWALTRPGYPGGPLIVDGVMSTNNCKRFLAILQAATLVPLARDVPSMDKDNTACQKWVAGLSDAEIIKWNKFYAKQRRALTAMVRKAIKLGATLECSV